MNSNELYHHGVKGMKWGVRKDRNKVRKSVKNKALSDMSPKEYQKLGQKKRLQIAQKYGQEAIKRYESLTNEYTKRSKKAKNSDELDKINTEYGNRIEKEVFKRLESAGYEHVQGWRIFDGDSEKTIFNLSYTRLLDEPELTYYGEKYCDTFMIDNEHKKAYDADDWE